MRSRGIALFAGIVALYAVGYALLVVTARARVDRAEAAAAIPKRTESGPAVTVNSRGVVETNGAALQPLVLLGGGGDGRPIVARPLTDADTDAIYGTVGRLVACQGYAMYATDAAQLRPIERLTRRASRRFDLNREYRPGEDPCAFVRQVELIVVRD